MKTFAQYIAEERIDEGMFDKLFQKAMEKLAVLIGEERMKKLEALLAKWKGQNINKDALKKELEGTFKTFKLEKNVSKEIQNESEELDEHIVDLLICANYGFWTAIMVKAALGLGIPIVLGIIRAAIKASASARRQKNPFAKAKAELDDLNRKMR